MKKIIFILFFIIVIAEGLYLNNKRGKKTTSALPVQTVRKESASNTAKKKVIPAIDFSFQSLSGKKFKLSDFKGKVIILNFRSSHCPACTYELEFLKGLYPAIKGNSKIILLPIFENESRAAIERYVKRQDVSFPVYLDEYGISSYKYRVFAIPTSFLIDKNFNLVSRSVGALDWSSEKVIQYLNKLANE